MKPRQRFLSDSERSSGNPPATCPVCGAIATGVIKCEKCGRDIPDPRIGTTLGRRYHIEALLGEGGFGRVYRGSDLENMGTVAIKFLHGELADNQEARARFKREARVLSKLRHPAIVALHDYGKDESGRFIVMEFVHGEPLSDHVLRAGKTMPAPRIAAILDQVLQVLEVAHAEGIVHRDIKPGNVMLLYGSQKPNQIKVLDFGLALDTVDPAAMRITATRAANGTPYYMSPEQCRGRDVGPPTDIYAVGVMLYELLAGAPPFDGGSFHEITAQHMYVPAPPVSERGLRRPAPPALEQIAHAALAKSMADRPTARQFREALAKAMEELTSRIPSDRGILQRGELTLQEERGMLAPRISQAVTMPAAMVVNAPNPNIVQRPSVVLWAMDDARSTQLREALAVNGITAIVWPLPLPPPAELNGVPVQALILGADATASDRTRSVRSSLTLMKLPVIVIDVPCVEDTASLIRAGASDVALSAVTDDVICGKVIRLVRRGR